MQLVRFLRSFIPARQMLVFAMVGTVAALFDFSTMILLREVFAAPVVPSALCGFTLGSLISYTLNRIFTFSTRRSHAGAGLRYLCVVAVGFTLTGLLMALFANILHIPYILARVQSVLIVFLFHFTCHRIWSFAHKDAERTLS